MKKIKYLIISLILIFTFNINVFAASGSLSVSSGNVYVGDTFKVVVNVGSAAAWNIHVSASGPVNGCSINQADATADAMDTNKTFSATCTATGTGTIMITLSGDVTSASNGNAVSVSGSRSVTVSQRPSVPNNNGNSNNNNNNRNNSSSNKKPSNNNHNNSNNTTDTRSSNNNIKELSVEGYELVKVDANNYTLSVPNDITNINVKAITEDSKSSITGTGNHNINVGENNIEIIVTAENGSQNKISIKVTRKDGYYLDDLENILKKNNNDDINIIIKSDTKITAKDLEKIKNSKKTVNFNYYDNNKKLIYSWIIDGEKLKNISDIITTILNDSDNKKDILRLSNYADGIFAGLKHSTNLPLGMKLKLFVGDKYKDVSYVNVYGYAKNGDKLKLVKSKIKVNKGYIEFELANYSDYFVTMSTIPNSNNKATTNDNQLSLILLIIIGVLILLVVGLLIDFIIKNKNNKNGSDDNKNNIVSNDHETPISSVKDSDSTNNIDSTYYDTKQQNNTIQSVDYNNNYNFTQQDNPISNMNYNNTNNIVSNVNHDSDSNYNVEQNDNKNII